MDRRTLLKGAAVLGLSAACPLAARIGPEAAHYDKLTGNRVQCRLCPHQCRVSDHRRGHCGVRENQGGTYRNLAYGEICAQAVDPIEKKPFFHCLPGTTTYSISAAGCNFSCRFCQNWDISQRKPEEVRSVSLSPAQVVRLARAAGCRTVAHTYAEPVVAFEFVRDCALEGQRQGLASVMVSNGFIQPEPLRELCRLLKAIKIDLKSFRDEFYRTQCGGELAPVLESLRTVRRAGVWLEIVVLLLPGLNDSPGEIDDMCRWIVGELGPDVPLHFSRFFPNYLTRQLPPTPPQALESARQIAVRRGIHYVYLGNLQSDAESTRCPRCGGPLIARVRFTATVTGLRQGHCSRCGAPIPGRWQ